MTGTLVKVSLAAVVLALLLALFNSVFGSKTPPAIDIPQPVNMETWEPSDLDLASWAEGSQVNVIIHQDPAKYNVDVKINSAHAWRHDGATEALRCLTQNGTYKILSEKETRNLHLLCIDPKTGDAFVAIIAKILRYKDDARNATTFLFTAFKLVDETVEQYIQYETNFKSIIVNLRFSAGELFFTP